MEPKKITARTALITGGAGGLGLAMARGLLADGHRVALMDNDPAAIERSKEVLRDIAGDLMPSSATSRWRRRVGPLSRWSANPSGRSRS